MPKKQIVQEEQTENKELNKYQKKTDREHILDNPDTYIGSVELIQSNEYILNSETGSIEKKDISYLQEYVPSTESAKRGQPKYYAMFGGATGESDTTSGRIMFAPVPDATYSFRVHYNAAPALLEGDGTNYISMNFSNGLLYCCLSEAYSFLKGPMDMLQLYEKKYQEAVQTFAAEQLGRRRRDDYTDGTLRIPVKSGPQ